jgi:hypothetical protein
MVRPAVLRAGYAALGLAFLALAVSSYAGALLFAGLGLALLASILLAFSRDDLPKWAGLTLLAYFVVTAVAFAAAQSVTVRLGAERSHYEPLSPGLGQRVFEYLSVFSPFVLVACSLAGTWERERPARFLALGAAAGFVAVAVLTLILTPRGTTVTALAASGSAQAGLLRGLSALSALAGAAGAAWSAARPEEYA